MKKVIITGATGLIGRNLIKDLLKSNYKVTAIVRNKNKSSSIFPSEVELVQWDFNSKDNLSDSLENAFSIIHLAGAGVFAKRWNKFYKNEIYFSRVIVKLSKVTAVDIPLFNEGIDFVLKYEPGLTVIVTLKGEEIFNLPTLIKFTTGAITKGEEPIA